MAGKGKSCCHVGALFRKIETINGLGLSGLVCTDIPCTWNQGATSNIVPQPIRSMNFKKPLKLTLPPSVETTPLQDNSNNVAIHKFNTETDFLNSIECSKFKNLLQTAGTVINSVLVAAESENYHNNHSNVAYGGMSAMPRILQQVSMCRKNIIMV